MFFIVSKVIAFFLVPSNLLLICGVTGVVLLLTRRHRLGLRLAAFSLLSLAFLAIVPVGGLLLSILESRFPPWDASKGPPDGVVVLGGAIGSGHAPAAGVPMVNGDAGRLFAMAKLAHEYPKARIIYTAGDASLLGNGEAEAALVPALLESFGLPPTRVAFEAKARNTVENATYAKQMAAPKPGERWLLVTSAYHMPRAVGCFRKAGFAVQAYPSNWRTQFGWPWQSRRLLSGIWAFDLAAREWIGLIVYRLIGKTNALLPTP